MRRRAFTLFQLLIALAVLSLLFALLLPAVSKIRVAAARAASQNNLKQIGLAAHSYYDTVGHLPSGVDANGFSTHAHLLPYIEQAAVYALIDFKQAVDAKANAQARQVVIKTFLNPLDPVASVSADYGATNYLFCAGSMADLKGNDGLCFSGSQVKFPDVQDGLSNTMLVGETLKGDSGMKAMDVRRQHILYKAESLKGLKDGAGADDWKADKNVAADRGASWMDGRFLQGTFAATYAVNDPRPDVSCAGLGGLAGLRGLNDGVNVGLADGSVRFVSAAVKASVWKALATRSGGEVIPNF